MIYFVKLEDIYVFIWVGIDIKLVLDYGDLFSCFEFLVSWNIFEKILISINCEVDKVFLFELSEKSYLLWKRVNFEID